MYIKSVCESKCLVNFNLITPHAEVSKSVIICLSFRDAQPLNTFVWTLCPVVELLLLRNKVLYTLRNFIYKIKTAVWDWTCFYVINSTTSNLMFMIKSTHFTLLHKDKILVFSANATAQKFWFSYAQQGCKYWNKNSNIVKYCYNLKITFFLYLNIF